ncbi:hypothetical protein [Ralstonia sp. 1138]|uniref:B12-binding domain-containing radical SAM protein n=1 Tax=Ralstonia sp. 1138 TaxID=3156423 RepID=UPI0033959670
MTARKLRIGVLELLVEGPASGLAAQLYNRMFTKQYVSIMPQIISVWCRQLGHEVFYQTYHGQTDVEAMMPRDLDYLLISTYTKNSALAYSLSHLYRSAGAVTVIGGPHAKAFPEDCSRHFDVTVRECDKQLLQEILAAGREGAAIVSSGRALQDIPTVEERMPEIRIASFDDGRPGRFTVIPLLSSVGCPYTCNFCIDWSNDYHLLSTDRLKADLHYVSRNLPGVLLGFHDPNFGVNFDATMDVMRSVSPSRRNPYVMESSLSILKPGRLPALSETNCVFVLPGIESWGDYSNKAGVGRQTGAKKLEEVVLHLRELSRYVEGIQANLIFGTDSDAGSPPIDLTLEFMRSMPEVWPAINVPIPYGGTPLADDWRANGRVLSAMPLLFYRNPYLTFQPAHYDAQSYYENWLRLRKELMSPTLLARRIASSTSLRVKGMNVLRTLRMQAGYREVSRHLNAIRTDKQLSDFHAGRSAVLPDYYEDKYEQALGKYAQLLPRGGRAPLFGQRASSAPEAQPLRFLPNAATPGN